MATRSTFVRDLKRHDWIKTKTHGKLEIYTVTENVYEGRLTGYTIWYVNCNTPTKVHTRAIVHKYI